MKRNKGGRDGGERKNFIICLTKKKKFFWIHFLVRSLHKKKQYSYELSPFLPIPNIQALENRNIIIEM